MMAKTLQEQVTELEAQLVEARKPVIDARRVLGNGAPHIRKGEDPMTSRPFMFLKLFGAMAGKIRPEDATVELQHCKSFMEEARGQSWKPSEGSSVLAPLGMAYLPEEVSRSENSRIMKSLMTGGPDIDYDEVGWLRGMVQKSYTQVQKAAISPAQSAYDGTLGGGWVPPPAFGEIIELLRNQEALVNAGARTIPLPPQGSITFPRVTSPSTAAATPENTTITASTVGSGNLTLTAKKVAAFINVPNELFRYASMAAEAILREDMTKSLALQADQFYLEGGGGTNVPRGLINWGSIVKFDVASNGGKGIGVNGNKIVPEDGYNMIAAIEENNAEIEKWIMRPRLKAGIGGFRADAVTAGDAAGVFIQSLFRAMGDRLDQAWCGKPIVSTNQISRTRNKGTATNLTYLLGGMWSDFLIGVFGAIEFLTSNQSDNAMQNDLTIIRGLLFTDSGPRHEGAFVMYDNLFQNGLKV